MDVDAATAASESAIEHVNESLKWLVGSAGAVAAILVAGVQLKDPQLDAGWTVLYAAAVILAVVTPLAVLFGAARILCIDRLSASVIAQRELSSNRVAGKPLTEDPADAVVTWVQDDRGPSLLGTAVSVTDLIQKTQHGTAESKAEAFSRVRLVESAVHLNRLQTKFRFLIGYSVAAALLFVTSLAVLVVLPMTADPQQASFVDEPVPVDVYVVDPEKTEIPARCGDEFEGVAVGGTLDDPRLVLKSTTPCGPLELTSSAGLVVIPK